MEGSEAVKVDIDYAEVPFFRRRWFIFLLVLGCMPAALIIALTGDIYLKSKGEVYRLPPNRLNHLVLFAYVMIVIGLVRVSLG
ncbi:hypothetical protein MST27_10450 [Pseudomonas sp. PS1]|uniref:Uncharacterized protein n=1 Tax=Stutzerimonas marianensis TaxID=2929513 RepID=A0A9X2ASB2_9GAMM|nr:hypothetical protein [Pseudomonas marianensis]MCJ0973789.1 hypothetical protein [Pseudomonas marianensis]